MVWCKIGKDSAYTESPVLLLLAIQCVNELVVIAAVTIGFDAAEYTCTVLESAGFVLLNIAVLNGSVGTYIVLDLSTIDDSALGGYYYVCTRGMYVLYHLGMLPSLIDTEDYGAITAQTVTFTPTSPQSVQVNVTITDDSRFETLEENFKASLTLISPVNIVRPNAITISPDLANVIIQDDDGNSTLL